MEHSFQRLDDATDLDELPLPRLTDHLTSHAALVASETATYLRVLSAFDRRGGWRGYGVRSCAHWLNWQVGTNQRTAQEQLRVAKALDDLPQTSAAFTTGELSYSRVRAITRVAAADTEDQLIERARHCTGSQLEQIVRDYIQIDAADEGEPPLPPPELNQRMCRDGRTVLALKLGHADAELVWKAVHAALTADEDRPVAERRADALVAVADSYLGSVPADRSGADRTQVVVHRQKHSCSHLDEADPCPTDSSSHLDNGTPIHPTERRRLECDATTITIDNEFPADTHSKHGPAKRSRNSAGVSEGMRRDLQRRDDSRCQWPGCGTQHYLHAHHIRHREHGGPTELDNLILLCGHHHRVLHREGFNIDQFCSSWRFKRPDGETIDPNPALINVPRNAHTRRVPTPETIRSQWGGEKLDSSLLEPLRPWPVRYRPRAGPK